MRMEGILGKSVGSMGTVATPARLQRNQRLKLGRVLGIDMVLKKTQKNIMISGGQHGLITSEMVPIM